MRLLLATATAALLAGVASAAAATPPQRPVLLVSGRDDHGLLVERRVGLADSPGATPTRSIPDATLVAVVGSRGEWIRVRALEGPRASGWLNDFYLRGTVHLAGSPRGCPVAGRSRPAGPQGRVFHRNAQVELLAVRHTASRTWVRVRAIASGRQAWVARAEIAELPAAARSRGC